MSSSPACRGCVGPLIGITWRSFPKPLAVVGRCGARVGLRTTVDPSSSTYARPNPRSGRNEMLEQGTRNPEFGADKFGFKDLKGLNWNFLEPELYECALKDGEAQVTSGGALCAETGVHTGRSPKDKYIVCDD